MEAGEGVPVVLLDGFPEISYAWRHQIPELAKKYRVIAPDLRGYGETDNPATGYDKRNMARDLRELMRALEIPKIALVGHDRGARVATRFAKDHPDALDRLVVMDNVPTRIVAREFNPIMARAYWFFIFNQIPDLPEALITGREDLWLGHLFADWSYNPHTISGEAFDTYVRAYRRPGAVRGALADYRANAEDVAQDKVDAEKEDCLSDALAMGSRFLRGRSNVRHALGLGGNGGEPAAVAIPQCGHLPQEEQPEMVTKLLMDFLDGWVG